MERLGDGLSRPSRNRRLALNEPARLSLVSSQPPIEDYAIIGDCRTAALISRDGSIGWLCLPDFSGPSNFGEILDRRTAGLFLLRPCDVFTVKRRYVAETPILETTFETARGVVRLIDLVPRVDGVEAFQPMREVLRVIEGNIGRARTGNKNRPPAELRAYQAAHKASRQIGLVLQLVERTAHSAQ
jgi:hypothetical protein